MSEKGLGAKLEERKGQVDIDIIDTFSIILGADQNCLHFPLMRQHLIRGREAVAKM